MAPRTLPAAEAGEVTSGAASRAKATLTMSSLRFMNSVPRPDVVAQHVGVKLPADIPLTPLPELGQGLLERSWGHALSRTITAVGRRSRTANRSFGDQRSDDCAADTGEVLRSARSARISAGFPRPSTTAATLTEGRGLTAQRPKDQ